MDLSSCLSIRDHFEVDSFKLSKIQTEEQLVSVQQDTHDAASKHSPKADRVLGVRKIKIKNAHHKTEAEQSYEQSYQERFKTLPVKENVVKSLSKQKSTYSTSVSKKNQPQKVHWQFSKQSTPNKQNSTNQRANFQKIAISCCRHKKSSHLASIINNPEDRTSGKQKKKIEFTVYQDKKKSTRDSSQRTEEKSPIKPFESFCAVPYPCTRNIVIDLLNPDRQQSKSKSKERSLSRNGSHSTVKGKLNKSIPKTHQTQLSEQRMERAMEKLLKFQIIANYKDRLEIEGMLQAFYLAGEPECKWALLTIDELFRKMRGCEVRQ